ncbi:MAG: dTDP-glucose 4,6-dehydratase [Planctomycetota bacterium]
MVTGGAGFIGSRVVRQVLATTPHRVVVLDLLTYAGNLATIADLADHPRFAFVRGDIANEEFVRGVFATYRPTAVLHLAAESHVDRSIDGPRAFVRTNVSGTLELLEAARHHWTRLTGPEKDAFRLLHVSTDEVHGSLGTTGAFDEASPYEPNSPYAASKAAADHLVRAWHRTYGLPTITTNCSNNYGPCQYPEKLIPLLTLNAVEGRPLPVYGDGGQVRDWLHVDDHARGLVTALERGAPGTRWLFGGGAERTNLEVVRAICAALERLRPAATNPALAAVGATRYEDLVTHVADRPGHDRRYAVDASATRRGLGWAPTFGFDAGIEDTVRWYLEHGAWCTAVQSRGYRRERLGAGAPAVETVR